MITEIIQIIAVFIIPIAAIYFKIIPLKYLKQVLITVTSAVILIVLIERWSLEKLGIRTDNFREAIIPYAICTIIGAISLIIISEVLKRERQEHFFKKRFFMYEFMIVSIIQEFTFRGFLFPLLQEIVKNNILVILINAFLFTLMHMIYSNNLASLLIVFLGGVYFATIYNLYPNLILISISHAVLNYIVVLYNFYRIEDSSTTMSNRGIATKTAHRIDT
jgi:uncharacterized protein